MPTGSLEAIISTLRLRVLLIAFMTFSSFGFANLDLVFTSPYALLMRRITVQSLTRTICSGSQMNTFSLHRLIMNRRPMSPMLLLISSRFPVITSQKAKFTFSVLVRPNLHPSESLMRSDLSSCLIVYCLISP